MQNFREKYAYRISLYLLVLIPVFLFLLEFLGRSFYYGISDLELLIPAIIFCASLFLRFYSLDLFKRWTDFLFLFLSVILFFSFSLIPSNIGTGGCYSYIPAPGQSLDTVPLRGEKTLTFLSLLDPCSKYNIIRQLNYIPPTLILFSFGIVILLLVSDIKRKREISITQ